jgi:hypothetical protein
MLRVRLPAARPADYLEWMGFWRNVERTMLRDPRLEDLASAESAPFLEGPVALFLSEVASEIARQATDAQERGADVVAPELEGPNQFWEEAVGYLEARGGWLDATLDGGEQPLLGDLEPLDERLRELRRRVVNAVRRQLAAAGESPARPSA